MNRSKRSNTTIISGNHPVIECCFLKEYSSDLAGCKRSNVRQDLPQEHQIPIWCYNI